MFRVLAESGDKFLGGQDFNFNLINWVQGSIPNTNWTNFQLQELRDSVESAKISLSTENHTVITVDSIGLKKTITRTKFNELNEKLYQRAMVPVKKVIRKAKSRKSHVKRIVFVGGTTRIPFIGQMMEEYFGFPPNQEINPDHAMVIGNAVVAQAFSDVKGVNAAVIQVELK
jgi:molecular chaperone DnaK